MNDDLPREWISFLKSNQLAKPHPVTHELVYRRPVRVETLKRFLELKCDIDDEQAEALVEGALGERITAAAEATSGDRHVFVDDPGIELTESDVMVVLTRVREHLQAVRRVQAAEEAEAADQTRAQARRQDQDALLEKLKDTVLDAMTPDQRPIFIQMIAALGRDVPLLRPAQINGSFVALAIEGPPKRGLFAAFTRDRTSSDPRQLERQWRRAGMPMSEAAFLEFLVAQGFSAERVAAAVRKSAAVPHVDPFMGAKAYAALLDLAEYARRTLQQPQIDALIDFARAAGDDDQVHR